MNSEAETAAEGLKLAGGRELSHQHAKSEYENLTVMTAAKNFNDWTYDVIKPYLGHSVLEIGSGFATFTKKMINENRSVVGLDVNPSHLEYARKKCPEGKFILHDIDEGLGPLEDQSFDTMMALNVFEHLKHDHKALSEVAKIITPGGRVIILVPAHPFIYGQLDVMAGHHRRYNRPMARKLIEQAGLKVINLKWFNPWSLPAMFYKSRIQRANSLSMDSVQLYDKLVPFFRILEKFIPVITGQSILIVGEKSKD